MKKSGFRLLYLKKNQIQVDVLEHFNDATAVWTWQKSSFNKKIF